MPPPSRSPSMTPSSPQPPGISSPASSYGFPPSTLPSSSSAPSAMPTHLSLDWASEHGTPVFLTLWDFSPPGLTASLGMRLGLGIWHSQLWLPDMNVEVAFGGHDEDDLTGIFNLPREPYSFASPAASLPCVHCTQAQGPTQPLVDGLSHAFSQPEAVPSPGPSALPAARYVGCWFLGYAGAPDDHHAAGSGTSTKSGQASATPSKTGRWAAPQSGRHAFRELLFPPNAPHKQSQQPGRQPSSTTATASSSSATCKSSQSTTTTSTSSTSWSSFLFTEAEALRTNWFPTSACADPQPSRTSLEQEAHSREKGGVGQGRALMLEVERKHPRHGGARARSIAFAMRTLKELKEDPAWHGKKYDLLAHNCNHFTSVLLERLTGAKLPSWINRTAGLGRTFADYIPASFFELQTDAPPGELTEGEEYTSHDNEDGRKHDAYSAPVKAARDEELKAAEGKVAR